jgi:hypothetical protein
MAPDTPGHGPEDQFMDYSYYVRYKADIIGSRRADLVPDGLTQTRVPRPPTERGFQLVAELNAVTRLNRALDAAIEETHQRRAVDRTFENEVRPW